MTRSDILANIAGTSAALVEDYDLTGMLVRTIADAADALDAEAGGLLVTNGAGELELLSATSHAAAALETYQAFSGEGPCQECVARLEGLEFHRFEVAERWPAVADLMGSAGYSYVLSRPLRWHGTAVGGLNLFWSEPVSHVDTVGARAQLFADMLTLFMVNSEPISPATAQQRVQAALEARAIIEQAKGVLVEQEDLGMADAYLRLIEMEREAGASLTDAARSVILDAQNRMEE